ncbi:hypothetical protein M9435_003539 [Picochlorum sp. BPE23]|nr:hypothetical protein M9435_003539 [Picochlorum sp. BPE23]
MRNSSVFLFVALWTVSFQAVSVHGACCPTLELVHNGKVATACADGNPVVGTYCGTETCTYPWGCGCGTCIQGPHTNGQILEDGHPTIDKLTWKSPSPDTITSLRSVYRERRLLEDILDVNVVASPYGPCVAMVRDAYNVTYFETPMTIRAYFHCLDSDSSDTLSSEEIPSNDISVGDTNADGVIEVTEFDPKIQVADAALPSSSGASMYCNLLLSAWLILMCLRVTYVSV